ncbi:RNA-guided endonuclease InsQ/TnpB family protein [Clostridium botulinum]|uniref:RNA-guided endonuclease InsQ/TnpB family protein n=1 Tax=Clostridium botulinum TaxID=1491 RepID=UPI001C9B5199|nr:RNA-guided endonuclease TnpB family protein [Clostridium botulinum]MBY6842713.1 IS200/IS605 family element transposase accessory protein TnpB [Clostridium botulinum]
MKILRSEQHQIKKTHQIYKTIDELCFKSKNLYNYANYILRQEFINNRNYIRCFDLQKILQPHEIYKSLGSQASQKTLQLLDKSWKSFFVSIKDWSKNPSKYLGKPKLPKYKKKNGRYIVMLKNIQVMIKNQYIYFAWKPLKEFNNMFKTNVEGRLIQLRFIPKNNIYIMEIIYEATVPNNMSKIENICGIDIGLNNFATLTNNMGLNPVVINGKPLKSYNQYWNKKLAYYKSILKKTNNKNWSNRLDTLSIKRFNKLKNYIHNSSKYIINYCIENNIDTIVIGHNKEWKQESKLYKTINQNFVQIPYNMLIKQIQYKAEDVGINTFITEESYTSGTSFLDNEEPIKENYNKKRHIKRGLFQSNTGKLINSDVNGAYQIIKKVFSNAFANGIEGVGLHPIVINL